MCVCLRASLSPLNLFDMTDQADDEGINYLALQLYCSRCVYIVQRREPRPPPPELCERAQLLGLLFMYIYAFVPSLSLSLKWLHATRRVEERSRKEGRKENEGRGSVFVSRHAGVEREISRPEFRSRRHQHNNCAHTHTQTHTGSRHHHHHHHQLPLLRGNVPERSKKKNSSDTDHKTFPKK